MTIVRKKLNKSAIILLALLVVGAIVAVVCHFVGVIDLSFIGDYAMMAAEWAAQSGWNVAISGGACFVAGMGVFYWLKDYIIGTELPPGTIATGTYTPQEKISTPAAQQQTVVDA
jgi:sterol desaturase/sphingolipid hydroxylase (fatty acid hydroxylase superfamily)